LRFPVTLKLISEKYVGDESARLRFLREARAAASVRHPNVASVFHLGRTGKNYFYAMENSYQGKRSNTSSDVQAGLR
jgi:serine/threonine protein kinase